MLRNIQFFQGLFYPPTNELPRLCVSTCYARAPYEEDTHDVSEQFALSLGDFLSDGEDLCIHFHLIACLFIRWT